MEATTTDARKPFCLAKAFLVASCGLRALTAGFNCCSNSSEQAGTASAVEAPLSFA